MDELGYSRLNLSRMMEDGGTVVCPLIPLGKYGSVYHGYIRCYAL